MNITWHGQSCFRILLQGEKRTKEKISLIIDPYKEEIGLKLPKMEADILLVSHDHDDHNNRKVLKKEGFVIDSPGEYELKGVFIEGIFSFHDSNKGEERGINTIFTIDTEDTRVCHLGDFGEKELTDKQLSQIGDIDVLMVPVGGKYTIDAKEATKIISQIEPRIVIPMHYKVPGLNLELEEVESFLKAMGEKKAVPQEKLILQKKNLPSGEMSVVPLIPQIRNN